MATIAEEPLKWAQREVIKAYPSAVNSGTVPDRSHLKTGGYHVSEDDLWIGGNDYDYSNRLVGDRAKDLTARGQRACCADDISMSVADMKKHHGRVMAVYRNRAKDPRAKYVNAINTYDGSGDAVRINFRAGTVTKATPDHKWHRHTDQTRIYQDMGTTARAKEAWKAARAKVSIETGQSLAAWLAQEETNMALTADERKILNDIQSRVNYIDGRVYALAMGESPLANTQFKGKGQTQFAVETLKRLDTSIAALAAALGQQDAADRLRDAAMAEAIAQVPAKTMEMIGGLDAQGIVALLREGADPDVLAQVKEML